MKLPESKVLALYEIKPYGQNPRRITEEAVEAVRISIERYGYQQPIVVDRDHVIIVGHTRLQALKKLGFKEVEVYVSDLPEDKAREYRLVDNKTSEMTSWDHGALVLELREFEAELLASFFPDVDLEIEMVASTSKVTENEMKWTEDAVTSVKEAPMHHLTVVECPSCYKEFNVRTESLPGLTKADIEALAKEA